MLDNIEIIDTKVANQNQKDQKRVKNELLRVFIATLGLSLGITAVEAINSYFEENENNNNIETNFEDSNNLNQKTFKIFREEYRANPISENEWIPTGNYMQLEDEKNLPLQNDNRRYVYEKDLVVGYDNNEVASANQEIERGK